jgi:peptidoglycan hydrolase-like protein with peptidoglycan-binding domain
MAAEVIPYVPRTITVHMGVPSAAAENITVSFPDYIKNVASSEVYPTWEPAAIRANVIAQISYALNRVYTEFYRSRGYPFDITATTAYDQKFIQGRNVFENISDLVDEIFNHYIRRVGQVEPLAAKYCNGTTSVCDGLSQWGSQSLAQQGYDSMQILTHYYGSNIELVVNAPVRDLKESYPGTPLRRGDTGPEVQQIQVALNRIGQNYPAIPKIQPAMGVFGQSTEQAVRKFQAVFGLTVDGIVGKATWYKIVFLYVGLTQLSELVSEGQRFVYNSFSLPPAVAAGDRGEAVEMLQYMLAVLAQFDPALTQLSIDGVFGPRTREAVENFQQSQGLPVTGTADETTWQRLYQAYAGVDDLLLRDTVLFPVELADSQSREVRQAMPEADYSQSTRRGQYPGQEQGLNSTDEGG